MARGDASGMGGAPVVLSVSELNARVRALVETELPLGWVAGEISNFMRAASGHCYFSLKDEAAQVRCVLFRQRAQLVDAPLANGVRVEVRAVPTLYEARGEFQLNVDFVRRAGLGSLFEAFERLKRRLEAEGLFDADRKRPLPPLPRAVGVVTSPQAAALRDVLTTLRRRMPSIPVVIYPTLVQGDGAGERIAQAIATASRRAEVDVLIVCRGGGSAEDLWAFNDERVARAIAAAPMPVISGVGHETDFTIADFVADLRAPTPTAAATAAVPDRLSLQRRIDTLSDALDRGMQRQIERRAQQLDLLSRRLVHPGERIALRRERLAHLDARLAAAWDRKAQGFVQRAARASQGLVAATPDVARLRTRIDALGDRLPRAQQARFAAWTATVQRAQDSLRHLDPTAVLERGYAIVRDAQGRVVRRAASLRIGESVDIAVGEGAITADVTALREG